MTLAPGLNLNLSHPTREIRRQLKSAVEELVRHDILDARSGFISQNIVKLVRAPQSKERQRLLTDEKRKPNQPEPQSDAFQKIIEAGKHHDHAACRKEPAGVGEIEIQIIERRSHHRVERDGH